MSETENSARTLVVCFDGTAGEFTSQNTNVIKFFGLLEKEDQKRQLCYYQSGVGTYTDPGITSPLARWFAKLADEAVAWYLDHHVMGGYQFLMENYNDGDKICIFGFSRGAYTARALAGMLDRVGLISRGNVTQVSFAYKVYAKTGKTAEAQAKLFKQTFSRPICIEFVGCWETVASTGLLYSKQLPFTGSATAIKTFRHALALDEHRARFQPNVWHRTAPSEDACRLDPQQGSPIKGQPSPAVIPSTLPGEPPVHLSPTDVLEVWFTGCHSDIGGGNYLNSDKLTLADITLRWMVREVIKAQTGILFNNFALKSAGIPEDILTMPSLLKTPNIAVAISQEKVVNASTSSPSMKAGSSKSVTNPDETEKEDSSDAITPINDPLKQQPLWWLVEILAFPVSWQDAKGVWHRKWKINFGRGRTICDTNPNLYITVKERMEDKPLKYVPRAKYDVNTVVWHDM